MANGSLVGLIIVFLIIRYRNNIEVWIFMLNLGLCNIVVFFPSTCKTDYANMQKNVYIQLVYVNMHQNCGDTEHD